MADAGEVQEAFREAVSSGDIVWDIGSYEGRYVDLALGSGARVVVAFEPRRETWERLVQRYEDRPVDVLRVACYDETMPGRIGGEEGGPSTARFLADLEAEVWAFPVDTLVEDLGLPDVLKIDVEGAEVRVLEGAEETLPHVRAVLVEVHYAPAATGSPEDYGTHPDEVRIRLEEAGLSVSEVGDNGRTRNLLGLR